MLTRAQQKVISHLRAGGFLFVQRLGDRTIEALPAVGRKVSFYTTRKTVHALINAGLIDSNWQLIYKGESLTMANETAWTMNTAQLEKGMLIRRPGLDEALEVVKVHNGQAKIKLPGGKTSTIPASAEVEWSRPASLPVIEGKQESGVYRIENDAPEEPEQSDDDGYEDWRTDWSLLDVGSKIEVLGEKGDFTVLRLSDSSARIKSSLTSQIQPLTIGHKFKVLDTATAKGKSKTKGGSETTGSTTKPAKGKDKAKAKAKSKAALQAPELPFEELDYEDRQPPVLEIADKERRRLEDEDKSTNDEPSDDELIAIENGDDNGDDDDEAEAEYDADAISKELDLEDDEVNDDSIQPFDDNDFKETAHMPKSAPTPRTSNRSLLTLGQISERTGISYPTLVRYARDHGNELASEGEGRQRRYLPESIEVFKMLRATSRGGRKPGSKAANPRKPKAATAPRTERSHETAAPYAAPARKQAKAVAAGIASHSYSQSTSTSTGQTIDSMLASAIDHAQAQISGLQALVETWEAQRESIKLWS